MSYAKKKSFSSTLAPPYFSRKIVDELFIHVCVYIHIYIYIASENSTQREPRNGKQNKLFTEIIHADVSAGVFVCVLPLARVNSPPPTNPCKYYNETWKTSKRVCVCGHRRLFQPTFFRVRLEMAFARAPPVCIIHGFARLTGTA